MKRTEAILLLVLVALAALVLHCATSSPRQPGSSPFVVGPWAAPNPPGTASWSQPRAVPGVPLGDGDHTVGDPGRFENLLVFPIYASVQENIGDFTTLEAALESGLAEVREQGAEPARERDLHANAPPQMAGGDGARVNTLVIENRGDKPILVLAGTVVKGGKQDRQIGQDFIIGAREAVPVDAFCVEHGRWTATRAGASTGGKFSAMKVLAQGEVRAAGQYERNQHQVWSKVSKMNRAHGKSASTDTLMATLDDSEVTARRGAIGAQVAAFLGRVPERDAVVGIAYAVDGKVRGARWFFNHQVFGQHRDVLVSTAAADAIAAQAEARAAGEPPLVRPCAAADVVQFVARVDAARAEQRDTAAQNVNAVRASEEAYGSEVKVKPGAKGLAPAKKAVTKDYLAK